MERVFFSFSIATVFFPASCYVYCLERKALYCIITPQACVFLSLLKCWGYLARQQLCAEPTGRCRDPGAIFAYCSSGCSKVSVLLSVSERGPGLETAVAYNTCAIPLLSQGRDLSATPKPHQAPGKWVPALVCHKSCPKYGRRTLSQANLKRLHGHTNTYPLSSRSGTLPSGASSPWEGVSPSPHSHVPPGPLPGHSLYSAFPRQDLL